MSSLVCVYAVCVCVLISASIWPFVVCGYLSVCAYDIYKVQRVQSSVPCDFSCADVRGGAV